MLDPKNVVTASGGLTADPEIVGNGKVVKLRLAIDYAGNDRDNPDNKSGYFNVTYFTNDSPNGKFISSQLDSGSMKKGSQIMVVGRLVHERWKGQDGRNASQVVIIAEAITYSGSNRSEGDGAGGSSSSGSASRSAASAAPGEF